jgi:Ser/Thr protein kinase RdoA (MazF antagonist)
LVHAPLDLCLERARARGLPVRLKDKNTQVIEKFMGNSASILALAGKTGGSPAIQVDNSFDLDHAVFTLHQELGAMVPAARVEASEAARLPGDNLVADVRVHQQLVYPRGPVFYVPRPDHLFNRIRFRKSRSNGDEQNLARILERFGLPFSGEIDSPSGPGRSENWIVSTQDGKKFLKCYKKTVDREAIQNEHSILTYLAQASYPAPRLSHTPAGDTFVEESGKFYALFDYLEGYFQFHHYIFPAGQTGRFVAACGQTLGELHHILKDFAPAGCNPNGFQSRQGPRWRELPWYLDQLQEVRLAGGRLNPADGHSHRDNIGQAGWLEDRLQALDETLRAADLPRLIIHGDYGPYNVFFKPGAPVLILDFELARLDWRLTDLANALYFFAIGRSGFRFNSLAQFLGGYFRGYPVDRGEMQFLPDVWQFLLLRRVIVCWRRALEARAGQWRIEAQRKLALAHWIDSHREGLSYPEGSGRIYARNHTRMGR